MSARATSPPTRPHAHNALGARVKNVVLMVPDTDWARVLSGEKRMFRSYNRRRLPDVLPAPAVAYRYRMETLDTALIWLEETREEPLGVISADDLAEEGFETISDFRRYFAERYPRGGFRPLAPVQVYRVRPITDDDLAAYADRVIEQLYGRFA